MIGRMPRTIGLCTCLVLVGVTVQTTANDGDPKAEALVKARRDQLRQLYLGDAASYIIHRGPGHTEKTEMRREPVYSWINPLQVGGQDGDVFVWTYRGRAEAVGTIYSTPKVGPRRVGSRVPFAFAGDSRSRTAGWGRPSGNHWLRGLP